MISAVRLSGSALAAASTSLAARADNIANLRTAARPDKVAADRIAENIYRPVRPTFVPREQSGVSVEIGPVDPSHRVVFDPGNSKADTDGRVAIPNVSLEEELVGTLQDRAMFMANLAVIRTADEMTGQLLDDEV
jgi:flagellar basal body rod protein FlgC